VGLSIKSIDRISERSHVAGEDSNFISNATYDEKDETSMLSAFNLRLLDCYTWLLSQTRICSFDVRQEIYMYFL